MHVPPAQLLLVGCGEALGSEAAPAVVRLGQYPLPVQPQADEQVEDADDQHGQQEEDQRGDQNDLVVYPLGFDHSCGTSEKDYFFLFSVT